MKWVMVAGLFLCVLARAQTEPSAQTERNAPEIRTPPAPDTPRINGPAIYGERPGRPFLYSVPATGQRPMLFTAEGLPDGLNLDPITGRITGSVGQAGKFNVVITARNRLGKDQKAFQIVIGDQICLTPPMGWNSWNCFAGNVDQKKVEAVAEAIYISGLSEHGWTYVNLDDTWQGLRTGPDHAMQANAKFPDMKGMCDRIHSLGLKAGIYSTPWVTSYAGYCGGSSLHEDGAWSKPTIPKKGNLNKKILPYAIGPYHFMPQDARQWAAWGFDYLKYDWNPIEPPDVIEMANALNASGRDFVYSLSNSAPFSGAAEWAKYSNSWRTCSDIRDTWALLQRNGWSPLTWTQFAGPGHWNDPDMLEVGVVGGGHLHRSRLTPDEQYMHITLWSMLSAPLLMGCDLTRLDDFTYALLSNDEVLAVDQDALGEQATRLSTDGNAEVFVKPLADGTWAVALINRGPDDTLVSVKLSDLKLSGPQKVRDLWRQKDLDDATNTITLSVAAHGAEMLKVGAAQALAGASTQPVN